jgi:phage FluMu protein Com
MSAESPVLVSTVPMHAHRCEACAKAGKEVVWIHPEADFGQVSAHKCPQCGTVNWKQSKIDNAKLPPPLPKNQGVPVETIIGYVLLFISIVLLSYGAYIYIKDRKNVAHLPATGQP